MNETPLLDQIRVYSEALVEDLPSQPTRITSAVTPSTLQAPKRNPGWAVAAVVAVVTLILVGSVPWLVRLGSSAPPVGEPTVVTTVPTTTDATEPRITVPVTPLEINVEWIKVTENNPPYAGPVDRTLGAPFVIDDGTTQSVAIVAGTDDTPYSLWTSEDGLDWVETVISFPPQEGRGESFEPTPSGYWYIGSDPAAQLWYSSDLVSGWQEMNLDGLTNQTLYPLTGEPEIRSVATVGDTTLIAVQYTLVFDWDELLGIEPGTYDDYGYDGSDESTENRQIEQLDPAITLSGVVHEPEDRETLLLRFIPLTSADGLTIADADSGETLFAFPNYDAFDWEDVVGPEAYPRFETELSTLFAVTPDGVEAVGPWSSDIGTSPGVESIELIEMRDAIVVDGRRGEGPGESYITRDGVSFESVVSPPVRGAQYDEASGYLYTPYADPSFEVERHWISPDGVNWTPLDTFPELQAGPDTSTLSPVTGGWLYLQFTGYSIAVSYFSPDGMEWYPVEQPAEVRRDFGLPLAWGNRLLIFGQDSNWVGTVDIEDR